MTGSDLTIRVYPSVWKLLRLAGVCLIGLAVIAFVIARVSPTSDRTMPVLAVVIVVFAFAFGLAFAMRRLVTRKPLITVDREGICTTLYSLHGVRLAWNVIAEIAVYDRPIGALGWPVYHYICIVPRDPELVLAHTSTHALVRTFYRWVLTSSVFPWEVAVAIPQHLLPMSVQALTKQIATQYRQQIEEHQIEMRV